MKAPTWRDIASAPRDGTPILLAIRHHGVMSARWTTSANGTETWCVDDFKFGPYAIRGYSSSDVLGWMWLPPFTGVERPVG